MAPWLFDGVGVRLLIGQEFWLVDPLNGCFVLASGTGAARASDGFTGAANVDEVDDLL